MRAPVACLALAFMVTFVPVANAGHTSPALDAMTGTVESAPAPSNPGADPVPETWSADVRTYGRGMEGITSIAILVAEVGASTYTEWANATVPWANSSNWTFSYHADTTGAPNGSVQNDEHWHVTYTRTWIAADVPLGGAEMDVRFYLYDHGQSTRVSQIGATTLFTGPAAPIATTQIYDDACTPTSAPWGGFRAPQGTPVPPPTTRILLVNPMPHVVTVHVNWTAPFLERSDGATIPLVPDYRVAPGGFLGSTCPASFAANATAWQAPSNLNVAPAPNATFTLPAQTSQWVTWIYPQLPMASPGQYLQSFTITFP